MIGLRRMEEDEIRRLAELDVSEEGEFIYEWRGGRLGITPERWRRPRWDEQECRRRLEAWTARLARGDHIIGAFAGDSLVGVAIIRYGLTDTMAELAGLWVSRAWRRKGIGTMLANEIERLACVGGAGALYVSACPSESAVGFYWQRGFRPVAEPHPELYAREPEDIHMTKRL